MRAFLFVLTMAAAVPALATDLAEANRLLEAKSYPQAIQLLAKLAGQGDSAAQLRLGQVYWYGEGVPVDRAKGDTLFSQSAKAGNNEASQAMTLTARRESGMKDITYWTSTYDGADLAAARDACVRPVIPEKSTKNDEINVTHSAMVAWQACQNQLSARFDAVQPAGKSIPENVLELMSDAEVNQAKAHLTGVYQRLVDETATKAAQTLAAYGAWEKATVDYVKSQNDLAEMRAKERVLELERLRHNTYTEKSANSGERNTGAVRK
jgi:TPR repeat protein